MATKQKLSWAKLVTPEMQVKTSEGIIIYPAIYDAIYSKFLENVERVSDNREQTKKHIGVIKNSVVYLGSVNRDIVVVMYNDKLYTADGEHLKLALTELNAIVRFKVQVVSTAKDVVDVMRMMNSSSKNWTFKNYINACKSINKDYALLYSYTTDVSVGVQPKMLATIMYSTKKFNPGGAHNSVKNGTFQLNITHTELNKRLSAIKRFYGKTNMKTAQNCVGGLLRLMLEKEELYYKKEAKFLELVKVEVQKRKYTTFGSDGEYLTFFKEMWNSL